MIVFDSNNETVAAVVGGICGAVSAVLSAVLATRWVLRGERRANDLSVTRDVRQPLYTAFATHWRSHFAAVTDGAYSNQSQDGLDLWDPPPAWVEELWESYEALRLWGSGQVAGLARQAIEALYALEEKVPPLIIDDPGGQFSTPGPRLSEVAASEIEACEAAFRAFTLQVRSELGVPAD